ncbi:4-amino-4-deoxychorismate lyase [Anaerobacillus arseniciselenatis]|uniref:4-amino-4-deoxychorismate lyase n=1 Tax=Anaerobacillus arseniciselenatis TaxID=85682 RepID=A0A1S2LPN6_9BACI|nr:aminodeoxychorismate lyase [Anaerobacillus arseniciselenatis]OIJ14441.1 4-amino-4-deoxychorismate lyase [Anaerobacillus arseniciselenatis]
MFIYLNGEFILQDEAKISPFDHGFLYGLGVFETFRIYNGHPFLLDDHFQRLKRSVEQLNIILNITKQQLKEIISELLTLNQLKDAYIRFNVSAGAAPVGLQTDSYTEPTIIIFIKPINSPLARTKKASVLTTRRNTPEGTERLKSHHYLNNIIGKRELNSPEYEGIFLTNEGYIAEGIVSNIFWVKDGQVYTPSVATGILNGITRKFIIKVLAKYNIRCHEGFYPLTALIEADEVFITNSIQEIVSISSVDECLYRQENKYTNFLQSKYQNYINKQLSSMKEI